MQTNKINLEDLGKNSSRWKPFPQFIFVNGNLTADKGYVDEGGDVTPVEDVRGSAGNGFGDQPET